MKAERSGDSNVCAALSFNFSWNMGMEGEAPPNPLFLEIDTREQNLQVLHKNNTLAKFLQCRFVFLCRHPGPDKNKPVFGMPVAPKLFQPAKLAKFLVLLWLKKFFRQSQVAKFLA